MEDHNAEKVFLEASEAFKFNGKSRYRYYGVHKLPTHMYMLYKYFHSTPMLPRVY